MSGRKRKRSVTDDEARLFAHAMRDARPLQKSHSVHRHPSLKTRHGASDEKTFRGLLNSPHPEAQRVEQQQPKKAPPLRPEGRSALTGMDGKNALRFSRGKMEIEGTLDLHGRTREEAHRALRHFITARQAAGKRCVLVITGKGRTARPDDLHDHGHRFTMPERSGILHRLVPQWLSEPELALHVVAFHPAQPKHGGDGALYVYLRRSARL